MIRHLKYILILLLISLAACHSIEDFDNTVEGNFDALWTMVDQHYCFFDQKDVDWDECYTRYKARLYDGMSSQALFSVCAEMLDELQDGHVNLSSWFNTSYYTKWWSDYPQNYDARLIEEYYLNFNYRSLGAAKYAILPQNIGYINYSSFESSLGASNIDAMLSYFSLCIGLIIDIRDNGGGELTNSERLCRHFIPERTLAGYMINKTGPAHDDLSKPFEYYFDPIESPHIAWSKPVVILTNRSTFSAANNFVSVMQYLPNVKIVGARTGGGSGIPLNMELPCGWGIRMSSVSVLDAKGLSTESGIDPTDGYAVDLDPVLALSGIDTILESAIALLQSDWQ